MAPVGFDRTTIPNLHSQSDMQGNPVRLQSKRPLSALPWVPDRELVVKDTRDLDEGKIEVSRGQLSAPTQVRQPRKAEQLARRQHRRTVTVTGVEQELEEGQVLSGLSGKAYSDRYGNPKIKARSIEATNRNARSTPTEADPKQGLRVATFNLEVYRVGRDYGSSPKELAEKTDRLTQTVKEARPDVLAVQEVANDFSGDAPMGKLTQSIDEATGSNYSYIKPPSGERLGGQSIATGIIYNQSEVKPVGDPETIEGGPFNDLSRQPLIQKFKDKDTGETFSVVNVHLKSKRGSGKYPSNTQGGYNYERLQAVNEIIDRLKDKEGKVIVTGDFNAYRKEDPMIALESSGLLNIAELLDERPNTFSFDGKVGSLDHILTGSNLAGMVENIGALSSNASDHKLLYSDFDLGEKKSLGRQLQVRLNQFTNSRESVRSVFQETQHPSVELAPTWRFGPKRKYRRSEQGYELVRPLTELPSTYYKQFRSARELPEVKLFENPELNEDLNRIPFKERLNRLLYNQSPVRLRTPVFEQDESFLEGGLSTVGYLLDRAMGHYYYQEYKRRMEGYYTGTPNQATERQYNPQQIQAGPFETILGGAAETFSAVSTAFLSYGLFRGTSLVSAYMEDELNRQFETKSQSQSNQAMKAVRQLYIGDEQVSGSRSVKATQLQGRLALAKYQGLLRKFQSSLMNTVLGGVLETISADREKGKVRGAITNIASEIGKVPTIRDEGGGRISIANIGSSRLRSLAQDWEQVSKHVPANLMQWIPALRESSRIDLSKEASMSDLIGQNLENLLRTYEEVFMALGKFASKPQQSVRNVREIYKLSGEIERDEQRLVARSMRRGTTDASQLGLNRDDIAELTAKKAQLSGMINRYQAEVRPPASGGVDLRTDPDKRLFGMPLQSARKGLLAGSVIFGADYLTSFAIAGDGGLSLMNYIMNPEAREARKAEEDVHPVATISAGLLGAGVGGWAFPQFPEVDRLGMGFSLSEPEAKAIALLGSKGRAEMSPKEAVASLNKEWRYNNIQLQIDDRESRLSAEKRQELETRQRAIRFIANDPTYQTAKRYQDLAQTTHSEVTKYTADRRVRARFNTVAASIGFATMTTGLRLTASAIATGINAFHDGGFRNNEFAYLASQKLETDLPAGDITRDEKANLIAAREYKERLLKKSESQFSTQFTLTPQFTTPLFQMSWVEQTDPRSGVKSYTFGFQLFPLLGGAITPKLPVAFRLFDRPENRRDIDSAGEWAGSVAYRAATFPSEFLTGVADSGFESLFMSVGAYGVAGAVANRAVPEGLKQSLAGRGVRTVSRVLMDFGSAVSATPAMMLDATKTGAESVLDNLPNQQGAGGSGRTGLAGFRDAVTRKAIEKGRDPLRNRSAWWRRAAPYALAYTASLAYLDRKMGVASGEFTGVYGRREESRGERVGAAGFLTAVYGGAIQQPFEIGYNPFSEAGMIAQDASDRGYNMSDPQTADRGFQRTVRGTYPGDRLRNYSGARRPVRGDYNARFVGRAQTVATRVYGTYLTGQLIGLGLEAMGWKEALFGGRRSFGGVMTGLQAWTGGIDRPEFPEGANMPPGYEPSSEVKQVLAEAGYGDKGFIDQTLDYLNPLSFLSDSGAYADDPNVFLNFFVMGQSFRDKSGDLSTSGYVQFQGSNVDLSMTMRSMNTSGLTADEKEAMRRLLTQEGKVSPKELVSTLRSLSPRAGQMEYSQTKPSETAQVSSSTLSHALAVREFYAEHLSHKRPRILALEQSLVMNRIGLGKAADQRLESESLFSSLLPNFMPVTARVGGRYISTSGMESPQDLKQAMVDPEAEARYTKIEGPLQRLYQWAMLSGGLENFKTVPGADAISADRDENANAIASIAKVGFGAVSVLSGLYFAGMTLGRFTASFVAAHEKATRQDIQRKIDAIASQFDRINVQNFQEVRHGFYQMPNEGTSKGMVYLVNQQSTAKRIPGLTDAAPDPGWTGKVTDRFHELYKSHLIPQLYQEVKGAAFLANEAADTKRTYADIVKEQYLQFARGELNEGQLKGELRPLMEGGQGYSEGYQNRLARRLGDEILASEIQLGPQRQNISLLQALRGEPKVSPNQFIQDIFQADAKGGDFTEQVFHSLEQAKREGLSGDQAVERVRLEIATRLQQTSQLIPSETMASEEVRHLQQVEAKKEQARMARYQRQQTIDPEPKAELGMKDIPRAFAGATNLIGAGLNVQSVYGFFEGASLYADASAADQPIQERASSRLFWRETAILLAQGAIMGVFSGAMGVGALPAAGLMIASMFAYNAIRNNSEAVRSFESSLYSFASNNFSFVPKIVGTVTNWAAEAPAVLPGVDSGFNFFEDVSSPFIKRQAQRLRETDNQFVSLLGQLLLPGSTSLYGNNLLSQQKRTAYGYQPHFYGNRARKWKRVSVRKRRQSATYGRPLDIVHSSLYGSPTTIMGRARKEKYFAGDRVLDPFSFRANYHISQTLRMALERRQRMSDLYAQGYVYRMNEVEQGTWMPQVAASMAVRSQAMSYARGRGIFLNAVFKDVKAGLGKQIATPIGRQINKPYRAYRANAIRANRNPARGGFGTIGRKRADPLLRRAPRVQSVIPTMGKLVKDALLKAGQKAAQKSRSGISNIVDTLVETIPLPTKLKQSFGNRAPILDKAMPGTLYEMRKARFLEARAKGGLPLHLKPFEGDPEINRMVQASQDIPQDQLFGKGVRGALGKGIFRSRLGLEFASRTAKGAMGAMGKLGELATLGVFGTLNIGARLTGIGLTFAGGLLQNHLAGGAIFSALTAGSMFTGIGGAGAAVAGGVATGVHALGAFTNFRKSVGGLGSTFADTLDQINNLLPGPNIPGSERLRSAGRQTPVETSPFDRPGAIKAWRDKTVLHSPVNKKKLELSRLRDDGLIQGPKEGHRLRGGPHVVLEQGYKIKDYPSRSQSQAPSRGQGRLSQLSRRVADFSEGAVKGTSKLVGGLLKGGAKVAPDAFSVGLDAYFINRAYQKIESLEKGRHYQATYEQAYSELYANIGSSVGAAVALAAVTFATGGVGLLAALGISAAGGIAGGVIGAKYGKHRGERVYERGKRRDWKDNAFRWGAIGLTGLATAAEFEVMRRKRKRDAQNQISQGPDRDGGDTTSSQPTSPPNQPPDAKGQRRTPEKTTAQKPENDHRVASTEPARSQDQRSQTPSDSQLTAREKGESFEGEGRLEQSRTQRADRRATDRMRRQQTQNRQRRGRSRVINPQPTSNLDAEATTKGVSSNQGSVQENYGVFRQPTTGSDETDIKAESNQTAQLSRTSPQQTRIAKPEAIETGQQELSALVRKQFLHLSESAMPEARPSSSQQTTPKIPKPAEPSAEEIAREVQQEGTKLERPKADYDVEPKSPDIGRHDTESSKKARIGRKLKQVASGINASTIAKGAEGLGIVGDVIEVGLIAYGGYKAYKGLQNENRKRAVRGGQISGGAIGGLGAGTLAAMGALAVAGALALPVAATVGLVIGASVAIGAVGSYVGAKAGGSLMGWFYDRSDRLAEWSRQEVEQLKTMGNRAGQSIGNFADAVTTNVQDLVSSGARATMVAQDKAKGFMGNVKDFFSGAAESTRAFAQNVNDSAISAGEKFAGWVQDKAEDIAKTAWRVKQKVGESMSEVGQAMSRRPAGVFVPASSPKAQHPGDGAREVSRRNEPFYQRHLNEEGIDATVTSGYGRRTHPTTGEQTKHSGVDLVADEGAKFYNPFQKAKVVVARHVSGYGKSVYLTQLNEAGEKTGRQVMVGHLQRDTVEPGEVVEGGEVVGVQGSTGRSTGDHFHIEERKRQDGKWQEVAPDARLLEAALTGEGVLGQRQVEDSGGSKSASAYEPVLRLLRRGEGGYSAANQGSAGDTPGGLEALTGKQAGEMTVGEVIKRQQNSSLFAVGAYQFIPSTLQYAVEASDIEREDKFDKETQDRLAIALINKKQPKIGKYLRGGDVSVQEASQAAAKEWASVGLTYPTTYKGVRQGRGESLYGRVGNNAASISPEEMQRVLKQAKRNLRNGSGKGGSEDSKLVVHVGHSGSATGEGATTASGVSEVEAMSGVAKRLQTVAEKAGVADQIKVVSGEQSDVGEPTRPYQTKKGTSYTAVANLEGRDVEFLDLNFNADKAFLNRKGIKHSGIIARDRHLSKVDRELAKEYGKFASDFRPQLFVPNQGGTVLEVGASDSELVKRLAGEKGKESQAKAQRRVARDIIKAHLKQQASEKGLTLEQYAQKQGINLEALRPDKDRHVDQRDDKAKKVSQSLKANEENAKDYEFATGVNVAVEPNPNPKSKATKEQEKQVEEEIKRREELAKLQVELAQAKPEVPSEIEPAYGQVKDQWLDQAMASADADSRNYRKADEAQVKEETDENGNKTKKVEIDVKASEEAVQLAYAASDAFNFTEQGSETDQLVMFEANDA